LIRAARSAAAERLGSGPRDGRSSIASKLLHRTRIDQVNSLSIDRISQVGWLETRTQIRRKGLIVEVAKQS
jgi:hypothetical protein